MVRIEKSENDKRLYKYITLENGLQAILISDPDMQVNPDGRECMNGTLDHEHDADCGCDHDHHHGPEGHSDAEGEDASMEEDDEDDSSGSDEDDDERPPAAKTVKKAAAALAVGVGSFSDPNDIQGLSHYLEHMLFMGSERFPDENEYDSFLSSHGGFSNAFTEMEFTNYHFEVSPAHLHGALDRFAQFFIEPLCKADALEREVQAVNNEFTGVRQNDGARLAQLRSHTCAEGHLYRKFTWGNRKSLIELPEQAGLDVRQRLVQYYKTQYSAERMTLAVLGSDALETMETWVKELFSSVPSGKGPKPSFEGIEYPYPAPRFYLIPSVKQAHNLIITFQLPSLTKRYLAKAEDYFSALIGHEGKGSLLSLLKAKGWATGLSAGVSDSGFEKNTGLFLFDVSIVLTKAGLAAERGLAPVQLLFEYLAMLRREGPQQWYYTELADIGNMRAKFKEEEEASEYVTGIVSNLLYVKPELVLISDDVYRDWDPVLVGEVLDKLTPTNCRVDLQTSSFDEVKSQALQLPNANESMEPWFEIPYVAAEIPQDKLQSWQKASDSISPELQLPPKNEFVPTDFTLACEKDLSDKELGDQPNPAKKQKQEASGLTSNHTANGNGVVIESSLGPIEVVPEVLIDQTGLRVWHSLDSTFRTPRAAAHFILTSPKSYESPRASALTNLALRLLHDALTETTYLAEVAGLEYGVQAYFDESMMLQIWPEALLGAELKFSGFNHKLPVLALTVAKALASFKGTKENFERVKEAQILKYQNANLRVQGHATYLRMRCIKHMWDYDAVLAELTKLTLTDIQDWMPQLWANLCVEAMVEGNMSSQAARDLAESVRSAFNATPLEANKRAIDQVTAVPAGSSYCFRASAKNPAEENSAIEVYFQCGLNELKLRAGLDLLEQILSEPCFNVLRTKEQLGYSVHCGIRLTHNVLAFAFAIVSGSHAPQYLDTRVEAFLSDFLPELEKMPASEFEEHRAALIDAKLQKDHSLQDQADRHWDAILNRRYDFRSRLEEVEILRSITKDSIIQTYKQYLLPASTQRARLAVQICCQKHAEEEAKAEKTSDAQVKQVTCPDAFKEGLTLYPAQSPTVAG